MSDITAYASDIDRARAGIEHIQARIDSLVAERASLMTTAQAELIAAGTEARVISIKAFPYRTGEGYVVTEGTYQYLESWDDSRHQTALALGSHVLPWANGPHVVVGKLMVAHGTYRVMLEDADDILIAKVPSDDPERDHRLAVGRLRSLARSEEMRVRVRDLEISLIDPMDTVVHTGTVLSAFAFLLGVEL